MSQVLEAPDDSPEALRESRLVSMEGQFPPQSLYGNRLRSLTDALRKDPELAEKWDEAMEMVAKTSSTPTKAFAAQAGGPERSEDQFMLETIISGTSTISEWMFFTKGLLSLGEGDDSIRRLSAESMKIDVGYGPQFFPDDPLFYLGKTAKAIRKVMHLKRFLDVLEAMQKEREMRAIIGESPDENIDLEMVRAYLRAHPSEHENPFGL
jgi:hypothetical protein